MALLTGLIRLDLLDLNTIGFTPRDEHNVGELGPVVDAAALRWSTQDNELQSFTVDTIASRR